MGFIALLLLAPVVSQNEGVPVFHGIDPDTGATVSRAALDTITPRDGLGIGLKIVHVHDANAVTLAFTCMDDKFENFDPTSAVLIVDDEKLSLTYKGYVPHEVVEGIVIHEYWYSKLSNVQLDKIRNAESLAIEISKVSGVPAERELSESGLDKVKEVVEGKPRKRTSTRR